MKKVPGGVANTAWVSMLKCFTGSCTSVVALGVATCLCIGMHCAV